MAHKVSRPIFKGGSSKRFFSASWNSCINCSCSIALSVTKKIQYFQWINNLYIPILRRNASIFGVHEILNDQTWLIAIATWKSIILVLISWTTLTCSLKRRKRSTPAGVHNCPLSVLFGGFTLSAFKIFEHILCTSIQFVKILHIFLWMLSIKSYK